MKQDRIALRIDADRADWLRQKAEADKVSVSAIIRGWIDKAREDQYRTPAPPGGPIELPRPHWPEVGFSSSEQEEWQWITGIQYAPTALLLAEEGYTPESAHDTFRLGDLPPTTDGQPRRVLDGVYYDARAIRAARVCEMELYALKNPSAEVRQVIDTIREIEFVNFWFSVRKFTGRQMIALWPTLLEPRVRQYTPPPPMPEF